MTTIQSIPHAFLSASNVTVSPFQQSPNTSSYLAKMRTQITKLKELAMNFQKEKRNTQLQTISRKREKRWGLTIKSERKKLIGSADSIKAITFIEIPLPHNRNYPILVCVNPQTNFQLDLGVVVRHYLVQPLPHQSYHCFA